MAINFFEPACTTNTTEALFGLVDAPPATLVLDNAENWNVWIDNENSINVTIVAIDGCLNIPRIEGERCEAMLTYTDAIMFVELKDRDGGRWAGKARDQLENTIQLFKRDNNINNYARNYAHIANKQRPNFKSGGSTFRQKFEDATGFVLRIGDVITIR